MNPIFHLPISINQVPAPAEPDETTSPTLLLNSHEQKISVLKGQMVSHIPTTTETWQRMDATATSSLSILDRLSEKQQRVYNAHGVNKAARSHVFERLECTEDATRMMKEGLEQKRLISPVFHGILDLLIPPAYAEEEQICQRPDFSKAENAYNEVASLSRLIKVAGGKLKENFDNKVFINGCSSRVSRVINQTGCKIPAIHGQTVSGMKGEQYIYRLSTLESFLKKAYGPPDCEWKEGELTKRSNREICTNLEQTQGIMIRKWKIATPTATGHGLVTRQPDQEKGDNSLFWELPNNEHELTNEVK